MKWFLVVGFVTACAGSSPPSPPPAAPAPAPAAALAPVPAPSFEPTSFTVRVAGSGRPVILIPGLGCPASVWDDTVAHLGGYQTHVLQLAGFAGAPAMRAEAPLARTVRDELVRYIGEHHLVHPVIVGHSMGGFIAMWLAATAPDAVGPVIDVDGGAAFVAGDEAAARRMRDTLIASSDADFAQGTRDMFAMMFSDPKRAEPMIARVVKSDRRTFANAMYELFTTDIRPELPKISAPVLALLADGPFADELQKQIGLIPHHDTKVFPRTRHFVMIDDPKDTFAAIDAFLAAHP